VAAAIIRKPVVRDLSSVSVPPNDFKAFAELCRKDRDFPDDLAAWDALIASATADALERKLDTEPLLLDVADFEAWCTRLKIIPCLDALRAYVIVKRREVS
jgi:hypothetical protein